MATDFVKTHISYIHYVHNIQLWRILKMSQLMVLTANLKQVKEVGEKLLIVEAQICMLVMKASQLTHQGLKRR